MSISYHFLLSFLVSLVLFSWHEIVQEPPWGWILGIAAALIGIRYAARTKHIATMLLILLCGSTLGWWSVARTQQKAPIQDIAQFARGQRVTIQGTITAAPDQRSTYVLYTLRAEQLILADERVIPVRGTILVTDRGMWPLHPIGTRVRTVGILARPKRTDTFAYDTFLSLRDIYSTLQARSMHAIGRTPPWTLSQSLAALRTSIDERIELLYPEPTAALLSGLLTGSRRGLPPDRTEAFRRTGLSHIIAISGTNITLVLAILSGLLFFLPLRWRLIPSIGALCLFTILVGAEASVVRACIMGILGLFALHCGRLPHARLAILWAASLMLLWNPKQLWYDLGFQLSFLCVIGLTELTPFLRPAVERVPNTLGMRDTLLATLTAQLMTFPLLLYRFGTLSLVAPLANILVLPLVAPAMLIGAMSIVASLLAIPLGRLIAFGSYVFLASILEIARLLSSLSFAALRIPSPPLSIVLLLYALLAGGILGLHLRRNRWLPAIQKHIHLTS